MDTQTILMEYIKTELMKGRSANIGVKDDLLSAGIIDSLGILQLVTFIEERFDFQVPDEDVVYENFYKDGSPISHTIWHDVNGFGNYWNDYSGEDLDGDGTGDTKLPFKDCDNDPLMMLPLQ